MHRGLFFQGEQLSHGRYQQGVDKQEDPAGTGRRAFNLMSARSDQVERLRAAPYLYRTGLPRGKGAKENPPNPVGW
jgi:hypothetical protein